MKLFINPHPSEYQEDGRGSGGIWRVVNAQAKWLPKYGVEIADSEEEADVVLVHGGDLVRTNKPYVAQGHGLYWSADFQWADEYWQYNGAVIEALRRGHKIIVPAEWVAHPIRRDMRKNAIVIPHGIEFDEFRPQTRHDDYILWAKPRVDVVSNPEPLNELARRMPEQNFVSTFGRPAANVRITGAMPYLEFQQVMDHATIWLATTRETGDIASREAMARGIPVVGWRWGATAELVRHLETGFLAEPGDYGALAYGVRYCLEHRAHIAEAAREWIRKNYQWKHLMSRYADVIRTTYEEDQYDVDITVIVPTYNYAHFLPEALESIREQTFQGRVQVVVVDDCSTDNTQEVLSHFDDIEVVRHESNAGLPEALNTGLAHARGKYVIPLDADNFLTPIALQTLYGALEAKPWLDVASGHIAVYSEDGNHKYNDWPFGSVDISGQFQHYNQLPSSSLMRRRSIQRLGGWRERQHKNEDGEFWCRAMSAGLYFEQVTTEPVLVYRWHGDNKSKREGGEDDPEGPLSWSFHYPWKDNAHIMPFACTMPPERGSWAVRSYDNPHISVCIACGPGHQGFLRDALDSVAGQTFPLIECIVCNDTGEPLDVEGMGHPWVTVIDTKGRTGPAVARNTAIAAAKAPLIAVLDADDMFYPDWLGKAYEAYLQNPESLVYADCDHEYGYGDRRPYDAGIFTVDHIMREAIYHDCILFPKQWWRAVGGYPTDQPYGMWEDWLFGVKMHLVGIGATYLKGVKWGTYRLWTAGTDGSRNVIDNTGFGSDEFKAKYQELLDWIDRKETEMACGGCRKKATGTVAVLGQNVPIPMGPDRMFVYEGPREGWFMANSRAQPGKKYRIRRGEPFTVPAGDAEFLFGRMERQGYREILPQDATGGTALPDQPIIPPEVVVPAPQPAPVVAEPEEPKVPERTHDIERLGLHYIIENILKDNGFTSVRDIAFFARNNGGEALLQCKGISTKRLKVILDAVEALEAA